MNVERYFRSWFIGSAAVFCAVSAVRSTIAAEPREATVTQVVGEVELLPIGGQSKLAALNDRVGAVTEVRSSSDSRAEFMFTDQTMARLGGNTIFSFDKRMRNLDLTDGAILLRVPKGAAGMTVKVGAVTAAVTGTTAIIEFHPQGSLKFISLEGTARLYLKRRPGESVLVRPGQMLITNPEAKSLPDGVDVDLARLLNTSRLIVDFPPLSSGNLIAKEIEKQQRAKSKRTLIDTNLVIFGKGTLVSLTNPAQTNAVSQAVPSSAISRSPAIPSSTDLGTIETLGSNPSETSSENRATDVPR